MFTSGGIEQAFLVIVWANGATAHSNMLLATFDLIADAVAAPRIRVSRFEVPQDVMGKFERFVISCVGYVMGFDADYAASMC